MEPIIEPMPIEEATSQRQRMPTIMFMANVIRLDRKRTTQISLVMAVRARSTRPSALEKRFIISSPIKVITMKIAFMIASNFKVGMV